MKSTRVLAVQALALALLLALAAPSVQAEDGMDTKKEDKRNFVQKVLADIRLGEGIQANQVVIFPLVTSTEPTPLSIVPDTKTDKLRIAEPDFPKKRYNLEMMNGESKPVFVIGGTVLEGGKRDRLIPRDVLLPPGETIEIRTLPAASSSDIRKEPIEFSASPVLAPPYLQESALYGSSNNLVPFFVTHFLEFRNEGDERKSLIGINESSLLAQYCVVCHRKLAAFPQPKEPRSQVVGGISAVRGRVQSLAIFGDNELLRAYFEPMLKGHSFPAAAIELRAKKAGVPLPGDDDPEATLAAVKEQAQQLLDRLLLARYKDDDLAKGELGEALLLRTSNGTRGRAVALDERLVHLVVFPHDPFERALYSKALRPPNEDLESDPERAGVAELERRGNTPGRRLTEAERRLLDRLGPRLDRNRTGGSPFSGGGARKR